MTGVPPTRIRLNRAHRVLIGVVVVGALVIAAIGFAGSYTAVRELAERKDFGEFAPFFPIAVDAGIIVLLSLDLLFSFLRIGFPLLRQTAWLLTVATIAFNGALLWPDPLGVGMHATIPLLFVVSVEAARHAVGRVAAISADKHMEGVRLSRWLLALPSTLRIWRKMKLWELRNYGDALRLEQERFVYQAQLQARYGRAWRRKAPVESLMPLKLAKYGIPLAETGPAGLAAAGITPAPASQAAGQAARPPAPGAAEHAARASLPATKTEPASAQEQQDHLFVDSGRDHGPETAEPLAPQQPEGKEVPEPSPAGETRAEPSVAAPSYEQVEDAYGFFVQENSRGPSIRELCQTLHSQFGVTDREGNPLSEGHVPPTLQEVRSRWPELGAPRPQNPQSSTTPPPPKPALGATHDRSTSTVEMALPTPVTEQYPTPPSAASGSGYRGTAAAAAREPEPAEENGTEPNGALLAIVRWIDEANREGVRLSGSEVARRLGWRERTGRRAYKAAQSTLEVLDLLHKAQRSGQADLEAEALAARLNVSTSTAHRYIKDAHALDRAGRSRRHLKSAPSA